MCKLIAHGLAFIFEAIVGLSSGWIRRYPFVIISLEIFVSLFFWTIVSYATTNVMCVFSVETKCNDEPWLHTLKTVFKASIIVAAIVLAVAEKTIFQLVSINYHRKTYHEKIKDSKKLIKLLDLLYDASRAILPVFGKDFEGEDADIQGNMLVDVRAQLRLGMWRVG